MGTHQAVTTVVAGAVLPTSMQTLPISAALTTVMLTISAIAAAGLLLSLAPAPEENT